MKVRFVRDFSSDIEVWVDGIKRFTVLKTVRDGYIGVMFEKEADSKEYLKEVAVVPNRFERYDTEEAACAIAQDLKVRGYASKVSYLLPDNFALEG